MCIAGKEAEIFSEPDSDEQKRFRTFLYIFATTILHELGHVFVIFIGRGATGTPPYIDAKIGDRRDSTLGEAGFYLEEEVFGGIMSVMRNPNEGNDQVYSYLPIGWKL